MSGNGLKRGVDFTVMVVPGDSPDLRVASAQWRDDQPDGLGVELEFSTKEDLDWFVVLVTRGVRALDEAGDAVAVFAQLRAMARSKPLTRVQYFQAFIYIGWLELQGLIEPDNYNGCVWCWRE